MAAKDLKKTLLNAEEAAELLRVDVNTLANWRSRGKGPVYHKFGKRVIYSQYDLDKFVSSSIVNPGEVNAPRSRVRFSRTKSR